VLKLKRRINKSLVAGLFMIFLMVGSTLAYAILQSFAPSQPEEEDEIELPEQSIIDYSLTSEQYNYLLRAGVTIVEFEYSLACEECRDTKAWLESATNEFSNQMLLIELTVGDSDALPIVRIESSYGKRVLSKPTTDEMMESFCDLLTEPPIRCATSGM
jgi:hypothetical protein